MGDHRQMERLHLEAALAALVIARRNVSYALDENPDRRSLDDFERSLGHEQETLEYLIRALKEEEDE